MTILSPIQRDTNNGVSIVRLHVSDTLSQVEAVNYIANNQEAINELNNGTWQWYITDTVLVAAADGNQFYYFDSTDFATLIQSNEGDGNVIGPSSATSNAFPRFNGTTGKLIKNSPVLCDDSGSVTGVNSLSLVSETFTGGNNQNNINIPLNLATAFTLKDANTDYISVSNDANKPTITINNQSVLLGPSQTPYFTWNAGAIYNNSGALTASQSGTTVTGTGTNFPATVAHGYIYWPLTQDVAFIVSRDSATQLTVATSQTIPNSYFVIFYGGQYFGGGGIGMLGGQTIETVLIDTPPTATGIGTELRIGAVNATQISLVKAMVAEDTARFDDMVTFNSGQNVALRIITAASDTTTDGDYYLPCNRAGAIALGLVASPENGKTYIINDISGNASVNNITITPSGATIGGQSSYVINTDLGSVSVIYIQSENDWAVTSSTQVPFLSGTMSSIAGAETTGIEFIPAPGAGKIIIVDKVVLNIKNGSTPWTGIGNAWLIYGNTGNDQTNLASGFITNVIQGGSADTNYWASGLGVIGADWLGGFYGTVTRVSSANAVNKPVCFTISGAPLTGNGTIDWKVWYRVIPGA